MLYKLCAEKAEETKLSWAWGRTVAALIKSSSSPGFSPAVPSALNSFSVVRGERKEENKQTSAELVLTAEFVLYSVRHKVHYSVPLTSTNPD